MSSFTPRLDSLPLAQRALWPLLKEVTALDFVLYGGTAIALRLGHRQSVDFDFFSDKPFAPNELRDRITLLQNAELRQSSANVLTVSIAPSGHSSGVLVSLFGALTIGRVGVPEASDDGIVTAAAFDDLMATKLKVIHDRVEARDYIDIAAMIRRGVSLANGLAAGRVLYGSAFEPMIALRAVTWFEDGDLSALTDADRTVLRTAAGEVRAPLPSVVRRSARLTE